MSGWQGNGYGSLSGNKLSNLLIFFLIVLIIPS